jgi:hypothetical protein
LNSLAETSASASEPHFHGEHFRAARQPYIAGYAVRSRRTGCGIIDRDPTVCRMPNRCVPFTDGVGGRPTSAIAEPVRRWRRAPPISVGHREKSFERSCDERNERYDRPGPVGFVAGFVRSAFPPRLPTWRQRIFPKAKLGKKGRGHVVVRNLLTFR